MGTTVPSPPQHVAVLVFPFSSHPAKILDLVCRVAAAGPDVTFSFYSTAKSIKSLFSVPNPENIKVFAVSDGVPEGYVFSGKPQEEINLFLEVAEESFTAVMRAAEEETGRRISCLVADAFLWFTGEMADEMGVPWLPIWTAAACALSTHLYTDLIRETVGITGISERRNEIIKFIPGFPAIRLGDLPTGVLFGNLESPFSIMLHKMGQVLSKAAAVAVNSFEELEPEITKDLKSKFQKLLCVGPFNLTSPPPPPSSLSESDQYGCLQWLDEREPASVAYIAFGTAATLQPTELLALAEALEASGTPFLWSLEDKLRKHLPEWFLERTNEAGKVVPWAPQIQVLAHNSIGVYITHCGWNSLMESVAAGVPIIGRPFFAEQQLNAWMVENIWKIGVRVEGDVHTRSGTMRALELVLSREEGKEFKERIGSFKKLALKAVAPNGSSTKNFNTLLEVITAHHT